VSPIRAEVAPEPQAEPSTAARAAVAARRRAPEPDPVREQAEEPAPAAAPAPEETPDPAVEARALAGHRENGLALEQKEEWRAALAEYDAALAIDPHVTFALEGRERALRRALLYEAIDGHLQRPERLSAPAVGREAEELIERARRLEPMGGSLEARVASLEAALAGARQPVTVVIESDGLTELSVTRVGRLGTLKRRTLELLPGSYTVTGSRPGYRDVRRQFRVAPGAPAPHVSLRCDEAL
jgi:tetratricopeptide (TPR) repeat protein